MLVGSPDEYVVAIDELYEAACGHKQSPVAGFRDAGVALADIDNVVGPVAKLMERTLGRTVVDDNNLPFVRAQ